MQVNKIRREDPESGASAAEYALLVAGVAVLIVIIVFAFGMLVRDLNQHNCEDISALASPTTDCS